MKRCPECRRVYEDRAAFCQVDRAALDRLGVDSLIGKAVTPRCRLIRKLGGGGLGTVYLGEEVATGKRVAVKVLLKELTVDDDVLKHCWWDARFATASRPSNIVRVYEVDRTDEGRACIVMEYLEGESLADVIRREGALEPGRALNMASQIAESLAAASKAGVTHGNLKPQDVMVVGPNERVKVTGFGVARLLETAASGRLASRNVVSPEYSAPEQRRASDASDIYSLGAVLYTMLTGTAPLIASKRGAADLGDGPAPLRTLRPSVPIAIEHFVTRAMARQPERRQSGLGECVESLQALTDGLITGVVAESTAGSDALSEGLASQPQMAPALVATERESSRMEFRQSRLTSGEQTLTRPLVSRPSRPPERSRREIGRRGWRALARRRPDKPRWQERVGGWKREIVAVAHLSRIDAPWLGRAGKMAIPGIAALAVAGGMVWAALDRGSVPTPAAPISAKRAAAPEGKVDAARPAEPLPAAPLELAPGPIPASTPTPAASTPKAAPRGTPTISAQEASRIRAQAEQELPSRGRDRVSGANRWGVTTDIASSGTVILGGALRDMDAGGD
jgi:serine/threonine protein kinase